MLGHSYAAGIDVAKDERQAFVWYKTAVAQECLRAQEDVANCSRSRLVISLGRAGKALRDIEKN
jgi:TPR repeat protein